MEAPIEIMLSHADRDRVRFKIKLGSQLGCLYTEWCQNIIFSLMEQIAAQ